MPRFSLALAALLVAACHPSGTTSRADGVRVGAQASEDHRPWSGIGAAETLHFTGTEPFWGGETANGSLTWKTPENPAGTPIAVTRFAGRNGMGLSGTLDGRSFELAVSEAACSDGMSERSYPFTVTVAAGGKTLRGCGWTAAHPAREPKR